MNNNTIKILAPLFFGATLMLGIFMGRSLNQNRQNDASHLNGQKFQDILDVLDKQYVDTLNKEDLFEATINEMLHKLDPHSNYIAAKDLLAMKESIDGEFGGIGVRFAIIRDTLNVTHVVPNSPSELAGLKKFDQIIAVNDSSILNIRLTNTRVQELLKGKAGSPVKVTIYRNKSVINKEIIRGMVPIESVLAHHMVNQDIGYIRLSQFSIKSDQEFFEAAFKLKEDGMQKLILDLRYNGGGAMGSAVNIVDAFLEAGLKIVSTKGKNQPEEIVYSSNSDFLGNIEIVVLINGNSASASEIVAGAIQDNDRGTIVGRRSFGKGLVQQDFNLKDGSNLRLTISRYYTPTGRSIQRPYSGNYEDYVLEEYNRLESGELYELDSSLFADSLKYVTPGGKAVYGGGGIMPDVFVPLDTSGITLSLRRIQYTSALSDFAFDFVKTNTQKYSNMVSFDKNFQITNEIKNEFINYLKSYQLTLSEQDLKACQKVLFQEIKAEIARQYWLEDGSLYIRNKTDKEVLKAIEVLGL